MEKECEICGGYFEANHGGRRYCDKCQKHSDRKRMYAKQDQERANRRYEVMLWRPKIFEGDCEICGKHLKKEYRYVWQLKYGYDNKRHYFCSKTCLKEYERRGRNDLSEM